MTSRSDGTSRRKICPHHCICRCHIERNVSHVRTCCFPCGLGCDRNILNGLRERHEETCHNKDVEQIMNDWAEVDEEGAKSLDDL